jgi:hypothetical protein
VGFQSTLLLKDRGCYYSFAKNKMKCNA